MAFGFKDVIFRYKKEKEFIDVLKKKRVIPAVVELMITQVITALLCRVGLVGLGRLAFTEKVTGSNPVRDTIMIS